MLRVGVVRCRGSFLDRVFGSSALKGSLVRLVRRGTLAVIVIEEAKTWRRSARRQHVLIDDPLLLRAFAYLKRHLHPEAPWFPFTPDTLSNRLNAVLRAIGIVGYVTLASFRTGGGDGRFDTKSKFAGASYQR